MWHDRGVQSTDEEQFAQNLLQRREEARMSQSELARRMTDAGWSNYSQMTVSRTEKGERPIRLGEARALAMILGASLDEMIGATPSEALALQVESIRDELSKAIVDIRDAVGHWAEIGRAARTLRSDIGSEIQALEDRDVAQRIESSLDAIDLLDVDVHAIASWALTEVVDHPEDREQLTVGDIRKLLAMRDRER